MTIASNWGGRLHHRECDKKYNPQAWAASFPHLWTLPKKEKSSNTKQCLPKKEQPSQLDKN